MIFIESTIFTRLVKELLTDEEYRELQESLVKKPDVGTLIKGGKGLRKIRWSLADKGKNSGVRIIYYWVTADEQIRMLFIYKKARQENLTEQQLKSLTDIVDRW